MFLYLYKSDISYNNVLYEFVPYTYRNFDTTKIYNYNNNNLHNQKYYTSANKNINEHKKYTILYRAHAI